MPHPPQTAQTIRFGVFEAHLRSGELRKQGLKLKLQEQPFRVLAMLLERAGELVTREELQKELWPADTFVDFDHSLNIAINKIREALGDSAENPRFVETLPRHGYRFIAPVEGSPVAGRRGDSSPPHAGGDTGATAITVGAGLAPAQRGRPQGAPLQKRGRVLALAAAACLALAGLILAFNVGGLRERLLRRPAPARIESIAVLPYVNLSRDPGQENFVDGMTDALITDLAKIGRLRVISRTSVMQYKGAKKPLPEIARELNVDAVVEGTVQRTGDHVQVTAQLLHAPTDRHLWAEMYERDARDVLALQADLARAIARAVQVQLTPYEQARLAAPPIKPEAFEAYSRGRYHLEKWNAEGSKLAVEYAQRAVRIEPGFAAGYALLAHASIFAGNRAEAKAAALKALELDDSLGEAHASLATIRFLHEWDWPGAEREFKRAIELNPNYSEAHHWY